MKNQEKIKQILDGEIGEPLKNYLLDELKELKNIDNVKEHSKAADQSVEFKAQKKAYQKLKKILEEIITIDEPDEEEDMNEYAV